MKKAQKKAAPKTKARTLVEINQAYTDLCAQNGQLDFNINSMAAQLQNNRLRIRELQVEGDLAAIREKEAADREAKKKLYDESKANGKRPQ